MKNENGVALHTLLLIIVVIIIIATIIVKYGMKMIEQSKIQDLRTNMLLIQADAKKDLEEVCFQTVNLNENKEEDLTKISIINKCIAKAKVIDFLVNLSYEKQIINHKRYIKFGESIDEIVKYLVGWKKSIKNNKE